MQRMYRFAMTPQRTQHSALRSRRIVESHFLRADVNSKPFCVFRSFANLIFWRIFFRSLRFERGGTNSHESVTLIQ